MRSVRTKLPATSCWCLDPVPRIEPNRGGLGAVPGPLCLRSFAFTKREELMCSKLRIYRLRNRARARSASGWRPSASTGPKSCSGRDNTWNSLNPREAVYLRRPRSRRVETHHRPHLSTGCHRRSPPVHGIQPAEGKDCRDRLTYRRFRANSASSCRLGQRASHQLTVCPLRQG